MADEIPNFHDGFFDGFGLEDGVVHLFLRTSTEDRFTLTCYGLEAMHIWNVRAGNIILDIEFVGSDFLTASHIEELYELASVDTVAQISLLLALPGTGAPGSHCERLVRSGIPRLVPEFCNSTPAYSAFSALT